MIETIVPIIVIISYMMGEIYKVLFKNHKSLYKLIPIFVCFFGAILSVLIYKTNRELLFNVQSIWDALYIGILSGASATSTNQIIKQIFKKEKNNE